MELLCKDENKLNEFDKKIQDKKGSLNDIFLKYEKDIDSNFDNVLKNIQDIQSDITEKIGGNKYFSKSSIDEIKERINNENIEDKIKEQINTLEKVLDSLKQELIYEFIGILSDLLNNSEKFQNSFINIFSKIENKDYSLLRMSRYFFLASIPLSAFLITIPIIPIVLPLLYRFRANTLKINDYFDDIRNNVNKYKIQFKKEMKNIKIKFIDELNNLNVLSKNEIKFLKRINYLDKFDFFINSINDNNYPN